MTEDQSEQVEEAWQGWRDAVIAYHDEMRKYVAVEATDIPGEAVQRLNELFDAAKAAQGAYAQAVQAASGDP